MVKEWKQLKCSICGGELAEHGNKLACKYCRAIYECVERISEDEVIQLNQATVQRNLLLFDDAQERYELILRSYPTNSEAAWGAFLCSYGIIYEQDYDGTFKPTCHRLNECPVEKSPYFPKLSDSAKLKAKEIETLRQSILSQAKSIAPYDVFICYKATDDWHGRSMPTKEANWARDIYEMLTRDMGLKVFFAEKCLSGSNTDYEPHIYSALQSAKLMLVLANSLDHVNAVWVQNEWRRYAKYIREGKEKTIRVIFDQVEPYALPRELQAKQAICHDSMGWDRQLQRSIEEIFKKEEPKKDARDEELEFLRKQIEELKKAQTAQANVSRPTPAPTVTPTPAPTVPPATPSLPDFELQNGVLVKYRGKGGKVTIPNTVTEIGINAFWGQEEVTEVVLPNTVKKISANAFAFCENLKSINLPTSLTTIEEEVFYGCDNLASVVIPNSVTVIGENAFLYCDSLSIKAEALKKPQGWHNNWNPSNCPVTWGERSATAAPTQSTTTKPQTTTTNPDFIIENGVLVKYNGKGGNVVIPNTVTKIGNEAFYDCKNLTSIIIPNSVTTIGDRAFYFCKNLTSVTIPNSVTSIGLEAFYACNNLTSISIPNSIISIANSAFHCCISLKSIVIPNSITSIGIGTFYGCNSLTSITIPNSVTSIGAGAFSNCSDLTSIIIPNSVTYIGKYAFVDCENLKIYATHRIQPKGWDNDWNPDDCPVVWGYNPSTTTATKPQTATTNPDFIIENGILKKYKGNDSTITIPYGVTAIGKEAFIIRSKITNIEIPNSVISIGADAFNGCKGLTKVVLPNSITSIDIRAFFDCKNLTEIIIPDSVTKISDYAFLNCKNLTVKAVAKQKPSGWGESWKPNNCPVIWGYNPSTTTATKPQSSTQSNADLADALFNKGWEFHQEKDYVRAAQFYLKACEYNHKVAQNNLGVCYANGYGVPQSHQKAVEYYQKAANQGYSLAQNNLGHCYEYGKGVAVNYQKAVELYEKAVAQNYVLAQYNLGNCYYNGKGVAQNYSKAASLYQKAVDQGNANAEYNLCICYYNGNGVTKDLTKAANLCKSAADKGLPDAQNRMGFHYLNGFGVSKNYNEAVRYFNMVADRNMYAQFNLGYCYENGLGVAKNIQTALSWYQKSSNNGYSSATQKVTELKRTLGIR